MVTRFLRFTGECKWAKVWPVQLDKAYESEKNGGNWSVVITLNDKDFEDFKALRTRHKLDKGKDVTFRRYERASFGALGAPKVEGVPEGTLIGNGSNVTVDVAVYPYTYGGRPGTGTRLERVIVNKLVEYKPEVKAEATDGPPVF